MLHVLTVPDEGGYPPFLFFFEGEQGGAADFSRRQPETSLKIVGNN